MARPSDVVTFITERVVALLHPIAEGARHASDLDKMALSYALEAATLALAWRANLTETDRRKAYGAAASCEALALAPVHGSSLQGVAVRRALAAYGAALQTLLNGDAPKGLRAAEGAAQAVRARFANVSPMAKA